MWRRVNYGLWELMPQDALELQDAVNSTTANGDTPLMIAAERGHVGFVKTLLAHAAIKINEVDVDGNSALCRAVNAGQMATIQSLFGAADINVTLGTPLHIALELGHASIIDALLDRNDLDINAFRDNLALRLFLMSDFDLGLLKKMLKRPDFLPRFLRSPYPKLENTITILSEDTDIMTNEELHNFPLVIKTLAEDFWTRGQRNKRDRYLCWVWNRLASKDGALG
ncbi:Death-associated protein kinase 1 [Fusarium oxysporum f. sp. rapae]|uniref:Death-associated protein kinase 1 n=1 Tax=Fusarium oxysporum f. sp. rapae TaxID=485398 RepID=A0A8J5NS21_FUSOX|nr:Death-associated protein kinase 1 [Fusarium oxysporum f. sp. rapae]